MLPINELKKHAFKRRLKRLDLIRKDYIQDVILFILFERISREFIFKGGTCLWKIYKNNRFSEDLDIEINTLFDFEAKLREYLELWGFKTNVEKKRFTRNALFLRIGLENRFFGRESISIEVVSGSASEHKTETYISPYPDIPSFEINYLNLQSIANQKVAAILSRNLPRDVYDLYFILKNYNANIKVDNIDYFLERVREKKKGWKSLQYLVIGELPDFNVVYETIESSLK